MLGWLIYWGLTSLKYNIPIGKPFSFLFIWLLPFLQQNFGNRQGVGSSGDFKHWWIQESKIWLSLAFKKEKYEKKNTIKEKVN